MRIGINAHRLAGQRLGVGRYIEYMLRHWGGMLAPGESVDLFLRAPLDPSSGGFPLAPEIRPRVLRPDLPGTLWENACLRWATKGLDVLFCPSYTAPLAYRGPLVVATHSVNEIQPGAHPWWYRQRYGNLYRHSARLADAVIVPAESTKADVIRLYSVAPERIVVIPQGADRAFVPTENPAGSRAVRERFFGWDRPYILFVGKCSQRRNIPRLLEAYATLRRTARIPHGLLLFGPNHENLPLARLCAKLDITDSVVQTDGRIQAHAELVPIYNAAEVFVHPSEFEGWSMTTVEAMACGTAVVAANRGGLGDLVRGHALTVDNPTAEALTEALGRVLGDDALRADLRRRARARAEGLTWEATTRDTLEVVRRVAAERPTKRGTR
jgi:glycosyltransferase involved in cell wall biosynthesis